jgi:prepilin-type N-terminal cleavage/methylation domain-containing protein
MTHPVATAKKRGFLLLEMILALTVFGIAATGFAVALRKMAQAASMAQDELRITRILDSALDEVVSLPTLEEGKTNASVGETGIELNTTIKLIEDLKEEEGQLLNEMYLITIEARWYENGQWKDRVVSTWRNGRMYQSP